MHQRTRNYYLRDCKAFLTWCVRDGRAERNPLAHLRGTTVTDAGRRRRALTAAELAALRTAAASGPTLRRLPGPDRAMLYAVAAYTGFRAAELASLTPESFDLNAATVTVEASYSKRRRRDVQPLPAAFIPELREWLAGRADTLWPARSRGAWINHGAKMIRADLAAAGITYQTAAGYADFHSLRHTFITSLARAGVHPKTAQTLARHSTITLTMDRYSHADESAGRDAVDKLMGGQS
jgi:integrase